MTPLDPLQSVTVKKTDVQRCSFPSSVSVMSRTLQLQPDRPPVKAVVAKGRSHY